jgi:hypothetical protein
MFFTRRLFSVGAVRLCFLLVFDSEVAQTQGEPIKGKNANPPHPADGKPEILLNLLKEKTFARNGETIIYELG